MSRPLLTALCFAMADASPEAAAGSLPTLITLIPAPGADGLVRGVDGRVFRSNAAAVVAAFSRKLPVDENHATHIAGREGRSAPAFGWVTGLSDIDGAVMGQVQWNERGVSALRGMDYCYLSPAFDLDADGNVLRLVSVGLTNDPNFPQLALNRAGAHSVAEEAPVMSKLIALALGLPESATEAEQLVALNSVKAKATAPDLELFVPRADHQLALNRASSAEQKLAEHLAAGQKTAVDTAIDSALKAGKITPATVDYHRAMCAQEGGLPKFLAYIEATPVLPAASTTGAGSLPQGDGPALNAVDKKLCAQLGLTEAQFIASRKRLADQQAAAAAAEVDG